MPAHRLEEARRGREALGRGEGGEGRVNRKHGYLVRVRRFLVTNSATQAPPLSPREFDRGFKAMLRAASRRHPASWGSE